MIPRKANIRSDHPIGFSGFSKSRPQIADRPPAPPPSRDAASGLHSRVGSKPSELSQGFFTTRPPA